MSVIRKIKLPDNNIYDLEDSNAVHLTGNQEINGQKDFEVVPRIKVEHITHDLPSGYDELEYIESTGTQYINTGVYLTNNYSVEIDFQLTNLSQSRAGIFGGYNTSRYGTIIDTTNMFEHGYGSSNVYYKDGYINLSRHLFKQEKNKLSVDGEVIHSFNVATFTLNVNCPLGTFAYTNYTPAKAKYYSAKIWNGDDLIRNFIPAKNTTTNKIGMYDIVNDVFYESAVTDNFVSGPIVYSITYENVLTDASFADVAFSGSYNDLSNKPTNLNQFTNGPGYVTSSYHDSTKANQSSVDSINAKIPSEASSSNQLADKAFVNSSIGTATATFKGTYNSVQEIEAIVGADDNDYAFYQHVDTAGNTLFDRYKYNGTTWLYEYTLNNSSFTADQWASINSGVSEGAWVDVATAQVIDGQKDFEVIPRVKVTHETHNLPDAYQEVEYLQSSGTQFIDSGYVPNGNSKVIFDSILGVGTVSSDIRQGRHADGQRLSIALVTSKLEFAIGGYLSVNYNPANQRHTYELDVPSRQGKMDGITSATFSASSWTSQQTLYFFARHMSSGQDGLGNVRNYSVEVYEQDQLIRQYIPCYRKSDDEPGMYDTVNDVFYTNIGTGTFIVGSDINPVTYESLLTDANFASVAFSGSYTDLVNKPTIPTVNNATLTIQKNGTTVNTFTANASSNVTANITVPTTTSDLTNDSDFITSSDIPQELYWCTYGTTTYQEISDEIAAGHLPVCKYNNRCYIYNNVETNVGHIFICVTVMDTSSSSVHRVICATNNMWASYTINLEASNNKITSLTSSSTNTQYPSAKCVYDNIEAAKALIPDNTDYVDLTTNQVIDGQKDFEVIPRVKVAGEHPREGLPDIYTQLQYVESNGSQYVDTGFSINTSTDTVELTFELLDTTRYLWLFGEHDTNARMGLGAGDGTNMRNVAYGSSTYKANDILFFNTLHSYRADSTGVYIDETKIANYSNFSSTSTLALFCLNLNGLVSGTSGKIQSYKHTRNNTTLIDLVPVTRKSDDKSGFYDFATNTFIVSSSGVDLIAGPEIIGDHYDSLLTSGSFANVAFSGSYLDLANTPTIPTVNNATLTIQKNGTTVGTFTANASSNVVVNIITPQVYVLNGATSTNGILNVPIDITKYRILQMTLANLDINAGTIGANDIYIYGADSYLYKYGSTGMLVNISAASSPTNSCNIDFGSGTIWSNNENISITILYVTKT